MRWLSFSTRKKRNLGTFIFLPPCILHFVWKFNRINDQGHWPTVNSTARGANRLEPRTAPKRRAILAQRHRRRWTKSEGGSLNSRNLELIHVVHERLWLSSVLNVWFKKNQPNTHENLIRTINHCVKIGGNNMCHYDENHVNPVAWQWIGAGGIPLCYPT